MSETNGAPPALCHRIQKFSEKLNAACAGREDHAARVTLSSAVNRRDRLARLRWTDDETGESGFLGHIDLDESLLVVQALFEQLRAWRTLCEAIQPTRTMSATAEVANEGNAALSPHEADAGHGNSARRRLRSDAAEPTSLPPRHRPAHGQPRDRLVLV